MPLRIADDLDDRPRERLRIWIRGRDDGELEGIEHDQSSHRINAQQVYERLYEHLIQSATRIVAHLFEDCRRGECLRFVNASRGSGIIAVGDRHDLAEKAYLAGANAFRVARQVDLHMVFLTNRHGAVRELFLLPAELEEDQYAEPRVRRH